MERLLLFATGRTTMPPSERIEINGIELTLRTDIADRDIESGKEVPDADLQKIRAAFPEHFEGIGPAVRFRWFADVRSHKVTIIPAG